MTPTTVRVLDIPIVDTDLEAAAELLLQREAEQLKSTCAFVNVHTITEARSSPELREALQSMDLAFADGMPVQWLKSQLGGRALGRVAGPELMKIALERRDFRERRHYLFGSTKEALTLIRDRHPHANVVGTCSPRYGVWDEAESLSYVQMINEANPSFVWVGLGAPKQELWIERWAPELNAICVLGVGAAFDRAAGLQASPPTWMSAAGLEWAFRLVQEPRRLGPRYLRTNPRFMLHTVKELISSRLRG